jgi:Uma2 family endonuclease
MVALPTSPTGYPMAPSAKEWEALSPAERVAVVAALPGEVTDAEVSPSEGDLHFRAKTGALGALRGYFARQRRQIYLAAELPIYYPGEPRFAPDLLAVFDRDDVPRSKWVVSAEGKGLDWVLEVHVGGDRKKDAERNVARYARLGIPEYFLYDRARNRLAAYRLASPEATSYTAILPNQGLYGPGKPLTRGKPLTGLIFRTTRGKIRTGHREDHRHTRVRGPVGSGDLAW